MQSPGLLMMVHFRIGSQQYGLPVTAVQEVVRLPALMTLAGAAPILAGMLNLRGAYLPVLNGRVIVGEQIHYDLSNQIIIIGSAQAELGLLVDHVDGVATFPAATCTPIQYGIADPLFEAMLKHAQGALILLNQATLQDYAAAAQSNASASFAEISSAGLADAG